MNTIKLNTIGTPVKKVAGGGASGGGGNYVYYSGTVQDFIENTMLSSVLKAKVDSAIIFAPTGMTLGSLGNNEIIGAGFDLSMKVTDYTSGRLITVGEAIAEPSKNWTQITEEEFYKTPRHVFTYQDKAYGYEEGQTWGEWVNSSYNTIGAYVGVVDGMDGEYILTSSTTVITDTYANWIKSSDLIQSNIDYGNTGTLPG